jgi:uncharacterized protein (TIGR00299 family) protein
MRTIYFDCFSGASGDMLLGALVDLGLDTDALSREIAKLGLDGVRLEASRVTRAALAAQKVDVVIGGRIEGPHGVVHDHGDRHRHHEHDHGRSRSLPEILAIVDAAPIVDRAKARARRAFERLGDAEARAHATTPDRVHFHEVGAADAIVDVVGSFVGLELLGVERVLCSPINVGGGTVTFSHGTYPVPGPATAELVRGVPIYAGEPHKELLTPTGAAVLTTVADGYGPMPEIVVDRIGYGAGTRDVATHPNVLRAYLGETSGAREAPGRVAVIEATVDDMTPEALGYFVERALGEGALDVYLTPAQMKKSRPGVLLTVLAEPSDLDRLVRLTFRETSTIGLRYREVARRVLDRESVTVATRVGPIRVKIARLDGEVINAAPEYDDCREAALRTGLALREVQALASEAYAETKR